MIQTAATGGSSLNSFRSSDGFGFLFYSCYRANRIPVGRWTNPMCISVGDERNSWNGMKKSLGQKSQAKKNDLQNSSWGSFFVVSQSRLCYHCIDQNTLKEGRFMYLQYNNNQTTLTIPVTSTLLFGAEPSRKMRPDWIPKSTLFSLN